MTSQALNRPVDVLARAVFAAYSRNSGNPPDAHYDRNAAEQWMAQALTECGVASLIDASRTVVDRLAHIESDLIFSKRTAVRNLRAALAAIGSAP